MIKIIAQKNNLYNNQEFIQMIHDKKEELEGIMFDIIMTKDEQLLVFSPISSNRKTFDTIQNSNLNEIQFLDIWPLEDVLAIFRNTKEKIILNLLPLNEVTLAEEYKKIISDYERYVDVAVNTLEKYKGLNLYLCSSSYLFIHTLKRKRVPYKQGVILKINNTNYIDVDFYIFPPLMMKQEIFDSQIKIGKEVMIQMEDTSDIEKVATFVLQDEFPSSLRKEIQYITSYTELFYLIFENR